MGFESDSISIRLKRVKLPLKFPLKRVKHPLKSLLTPSQTSISRKQMDIQNTERIDALKPRPAWLKQAPGH